MSGKLSLGLKFGHFRGVIPLLPEGHSKDWGTRGCEGALSSHHWVWSCWQESSAEGRHEACTANPPLHTSVSLLVSMGTFSTVYPGPGQQQQQSQRSLLFVISAEQMNHCCTSSDHFCFITPCSFHYKKSTLEQSKLICLLVVLTFLLIFRM